jgi:putative lipoic acid-binding regulatory protein
MGEKFNGVKVFSATMAQERDQLGEKVTQWLRQNPGAKVVDTIVKQSSDQAFHCLSITLFYEAAAS